jgi:hypothetical protein
MTIQLDDVAAVLNTTALNNNFQKIEDELNTGVLKRQGLGAGQANQMEVNLDMNSKDILNVRNLNAQEVIVKGKSVDALVTTASNAAISASASAVAAGLSEASAEADAIRAETAANASDVVAVRTDLANTVDPLKGAALLGRSNQVVSSIASLRLLLSSSSSKHAFATGYYAQGDGGGGNYYIDAADTVSADNGGTIIVAADGARWKLARTDMVSIKQFGAVGDGVTDSTVAIQKAINAGWAIYIPIGVYIISATLREKTNGGALRIVGENRKRSILRAPLLAAPILWVGNSNGHGNYRADFSTFSIDGVNKTTGSVGMILHEAGTSHISDVDIRNVDVQCKAVGVISVTFDGKCEWGTSNSGLLFSQPVTGVPASEDDLLVTASPLSLSTNVNEVRDIWFTAVSGDVIVVKGGLTNIRGVTLQGCGSDVNRDLVSLIQANESFDFGGGASFEGWIEGGSYRYAIAIRNTNGAKIGSQTFISGSSSNSPTNLPKEGGIFVDLPSRHTVIEKGVSIRGFFVAPPTESRLANGAIYTIGTQRREDVFSPYIVRSQVLPYYETLISPTKQRGSNDYEISFAIAGGVPTLDYDSHGIVSNVTRSVAGDYIVTFNFNREVIPSFPTVISTRSNSATKSYSASLFGGGNASNERILVVDELGAFADPRSVQLRFAAAWQGL